MLSTVLAAPRVCRICVLLTHLFHLLVTPYEKVLANIPISRCISETIQDRTIVTIEDKSAIFSDFQ